MQVKLIEGLHCEFSPTDNNVAYCLRQLTGGPNYALVGTSLITTKEVVDGMDFVQEQLRISVQYPTTPAETSYQTFVVLLDRGGCRGI
jgi:hypothetical protein